MEFKVLDLCSGIGGLSAGFALALKGDYGLENKLFFTGVDVWELALIGYKRNISFVSDGVRVFRRDVTEFFPRGEFDIVVSGPPCKPFSINTPTRLLGKKHPMYPVFESVFEAISVIQPEMFLIENVPGILRFRFLIEELRKKFLNGYKVVVTKLEMHQFGLPQKRTRVFIFGIKGGVSPWNWIRRLLDNKERSVKSGEFLVDLEYRGDLSWRIKAKLTRVEIKHALKFGYYTSYNDTSRTIRASPEHLLIRDREVRPIEVREALRLQGAPDWFEPPKTTPRQAMKLVGDIVPPLIAYKIAYNIFLEYITDIEENDYLPALPDVVYHGRSEWKWLVDAIDYGANMFWSWWPNRIKQLSLII